MKKIILSVMAVAAVVSASAEGLAGFGVKAGLNLSNVNTKYVGDNDAIKDAVDEEDKDYSKMKPSFYVGVTYEMAFSEKFAFQPELVYSREGENYKDNDDDDVTGNFRRNYLNIPLMVKYAIMENLTVSAGPQIGILLNAKDVYKYDIDGVEYKEITEYSGYKPEAEIDGNTYTDFNGTYAPINISVGVGAEYMLNEKIGIEARYNFGLSNIWPTRIAPEDYKQKTGTLQIGATYAF